MRKRTSSNNQGSVSPYLFFSKELLMTDSRAETMPVRPGNFARSEIPYFHTHHDDCTTQQIAKINPSISKASLRNNKLNNTTNCNVSKKESCHIIC